MHMLQALRVPTHYEEQMYVTSVSGKKVLINR